MRIVVILVCLLSFTVPSPSQSGQSGKKQKASSGYQLHPPNRAPTLEDTLRGVESYKPLKGFVPDEATAVRIAEAVLVPIFGEEQIRSERPFKAALQKESWLVKGTLPPGVKGGTAIVKIAKSDGRILFLVHQQ